MNNSYNDFLDFVIKNISEDFDINLDNDYKSTILSTYERTISKKKIPSPSKNSVKKLNSPKTVNKGKAEVHKCERIPKNRTTVCGQNARNEVDGKWYCGTKNSGCYRAILNKLKKQEGSINSYPTKSSFDSGKSPKKQSSSSSSIRSPQKKTSPQRASSSSSSVRSPQRKTSPQKASSSSSSVRSPQRKTSPYPTKSSFSKPKTGLASKKEEKDIKSKALSSSVNRSQKTILRGITIDGKKYYHNKKLNVIYNDDKEAIGLLSKDKSSIEDLDDETERILVSSGVTIKRLQNLDPDSDIDEDIDLCDDSDIDIPDSEDDEDANVSDEDIEEFDINSSDDDEEIDDIEDD